MAEAANLSIFGFGLASVLLSQRRILRPLPARWLARSSARI